MRDIEKLRRRFEAAGQGHVFRFWDALDRPRRAGLRKQLETVDLDWIAEVGKGLRDGTFGFRFEGELTPADCIPIAETAEDAERDRRARHVGEQLVRQGKVAALVVAGGQGTRLGFDDPKGCFPIGPVTGNSLFQLHAESVLAMRRRHGSAIPLYIMTSEATDAPSREFFERHEYFGLPEEDVRFFVQGMLPALTPEGKLALVRKDRILTSPNGHGGTLTALRDEGMLDDMEKRGIEEISYFQVDNPLVRQVDPLFLGHHRLAEGEMSSKAIPKRDPEEKLGAFGYVDGRMSVVEYSDLSDERMYRRREDGSLVFGLGSPAMHALNVAFVRRIVSEGPGLPFHVAEKSSPYVNEEGEIVEPAGKNVRKFEKFIFDALPLTERSVILEVRREEEFSPVKNAEGEDSPATARRDMIARWARWLERAGGRVPRDADGRVDSTIEIGPLYALGAQELRGKVPPDLEVGDELLLY